MKKGMTLVEVLLSTAIFSFVSICLFALFKLGQSYWGRGMTYNTIQNEMKKTTTILQKTLRQTDYRYIFHQNNTTLDDLPRDSIFFPLQTEKGDFEYVGIVCTIDRQQPENTGHLFYVRFKVSSSTQPSTFIVENITNIRSSNVRTLRITGGVNSSEVIISGLSTNIYAFDILMNNMENTVTIRMNFVKRTVGENSTQTIGASLFVTPLNNFGQ
ncbi:MAG: hypothetical protein ABDH21_05630 [bacterium]